MGRISVVCCLRLFVFLLRRFLYYNILGGGRDRFCCIILPEKVKYDLRQDNFRNGIKIGGEQISSLTVFYQAPAKKF